MLAIQGRIGSRNPGPQDCGEDHSSILVVGMQNMEECLERDVLGTPKPQGDRRFHTDLPCNKTLRTLLWQTVSSSLGLTASSITRAAPTEDLPQCTTGVITTEERESGFRLWPWSYTTFRYPTRVNNPPDIPKRFMAGYTPIICTKLLLCRAS
jgi:hypothetical protein